MCYFIKPLSILFIICFVEIFNVFGQRHRDTLTNGDTTVIRKFKKNGKLRSEETFLKGELISIKSWFYSKNSYGYYDGFINDPKKVKIREFYTNGKLRVEGSTFKGKKDGNYNTYYSNGQSQCQCNYVNGKEDSVQIQHFENGQLSYRGNYRNGKQEGSEVIYFDNGQIWTERIYVAGKKWMVLSNFDRNGRIMEKGTLKDGNGTLFLYGENGELESIELYKKGKLIKTEKKNST